mgnify:CR=1 FL=1
MDKDPIGKVVVPQTEGYWQERYDKKEDQWEKGAPSPGLVDFLARLAPEQKAGRVIQPGCGRGHDLAAFAEAGFSGVGIDIAPTAVEDARKLHGTFVEGGELDFSCENYFETSAGKWRGQFDWYFEHTFFCAIEPALRDQYVRSVLDVLKPGGYFLAIFFHIQSDEGPPFGTTQAELETRFLPHFELIEAKVPRSYTNRTGLELLWWMKRK